MGRWMIRRSQMECKADAGLGGAAINRNRIRPEASSVLALLLAGVAIVAALAVAHGASAATRGESGTVVSIYDGDTLTLSSGQRVRLLQIDTSELGSGE